MRTYESKSNVVLVEAFIPSSCCKACKSFAILGPGLAEPSGSRRLSFAIHDPILRVGACLPDLILVGFGVPAGSGRLC